MFHIGVCQLSAVPVKHTTSSSPLLKFRNWVKACGFCSISTYTALSSDQNYLLYQSIFKLSDKDIPTVWLDILQGIFSSTGSEQLHKLHEHFQKFVQSRNVPLLSFGELEKTKISNTLPRLFLVPPESSGKKRHLFSHFTICLTLLFHHVTTVHFQLFIFDCIKQFCISLSVLV